MLNQRINLREDASVSTDVTTVSATDGDSVNGQALTKNEVNTLSFPMGNIGDRFFSVRNVICICRKVLYIS